MVWTIVGSCAAALTMFSFIPQIIKVYKHKCARDVSLIMLVQMSLGVLLWFIYGVYRKDAIIMIANFTSLVTLVILLFLYFNYGRARK